MTNEQTDKLLKLLNDISASMDAMTERMARADAANLALRVIVARLLVCVANNGPGAPAARLDFLVTQLRGLLEGSLASNPVYDENLNAGAYSAMEDTVSLAEAMLSAMMVPTGRPPDQSVN